MARHACCLHPKDLRPTSLCLLCSTGDRASLLMEETAAADHSYERDGPNLHEQMLLLTTLFDGYSKQAHMLVSLPTLLPSLPQPGTCMRVSWSAGPGGWLHQPDQHT